MYLGNFRTARGLSDRKRKSSTSSTERFFAPHGAYQGAFHMSNGKNNEAANKQEVLESVQTICSIGFRLPNGRNAEEILRKTKAMLKEEQGKPNSSGSSLHSSLRFPKVFLWISHIPRAKANGINGLDFPSNFSYFIFSVAHVKSF